jgi:hypothetical protein
MDLLQVAHLPALLGLVGWCTCRWSEDSCSDWNNHIVQSAHVVRVVAFEWPVKEYTPQTTVPGVCRLQSGKRRHTGTETTLRQPAKTPRCKIPTPYKQHGKVGSSMARCDWEEEVHCIATTLAGERGLTSHLVQPILRILRLQQQEHHPATRQSAV